ncbi:DgyrCDS13423 [Dimorphilus gyrociliatus]|uniref:DgyrCDS13423 n=1 Tax=Dimorphilus gyrociliatus TaxID=2664684 RepID=A0A7I8WAL4_9ANNE|nr:DgyrCDS13423 [Dimorphilus gyrociliatus]
MARKYIIFYRIFSIKNILIITALGGLFFFLNSFKISSIADKLNDTLRETTKNQKQYWILSKSHTCIEAAEFVPRNWYLSIEKSNGIFNCEIDKSYKNDFEYLEDVLRNGGEQIVVVGSHSSMFTNHLSSSTLIIPNRTTYEGYVCKEAPHSITIESDAFHMKDWNIPFHILQETLKFSPLTNVIFKRNAFWLFPLWKDRRNLGQALGLLNSYSFVRTVYNEHLKKSDEKLNSIKIRCINETLKNCLKSLPKTEILEETIRILDKQSYKWPFAFLQYDSYYKKCSRVFWKERGERQMKDENCQEVKIKDRLLRQTKSIEDVFLLVVFNNPFYNNIPYINSLYGKIFKYMAYCGPHSAPILYGGIFIQYQNVQDHVAGAFSYICSNILLSLDHKHTNGLIVISDDMLFNVHSISDLPRTKIWLSPSKIGNIKIGKECRLGMCDFYTSWTWWTVYRTETINSLEALLKSKKRTLRACAENIKILTGDLYHVYGGYSDFFYIPSTYNENFIILTNHFLKYNVFVELAIPITLHCLDVSKEAIETIEGLADWTENRDFPWNHLHKFDILMYLHPVKLSLMVKELVVYLISKDLITQEKSEVNDLKVVDKTRTNWIVLDDYFCHEVEQVIPKSWILNVRIKSKIYSCEKDKTYQDDLEFLEDVVLSGGEKIALFKSLPTDFSKWTQSSTLIIHDATTNKGEVCMKTPHSLTVETVDFPMNDWDSPFHVKNRLIKIPVAADILFNSDSFWLFPLMDNIPLFRKALGLLNSHTIIRTIDNRDYLGLKSIPPSMRIDCSSKTIFECLKSFESSDLLSRTLNTLQKLRYHWPTSLPEDRETKSCYTVIWKDEGEKPMAEPNCHEVNLHAPLTGQMPMRDDVLLMIVYNHPLYKSLPYVNSLYGKLFKYIAYCGPNELPENFKNFFVRYINYKGHITGGFGQTCTSVLLSLRHRHTRGLLIISDDMLLNVHRLSQASLFHVWVKGAYKRDIRKIDNERTWLQWKKYKNDIKMALGDLYTSSDVHLRQCGQRLENIGGTRYTVSGGYSDIYYIPYSLSNEFVKLNNHFLDYQIPFEISVPTVILCMSKKQPLKNVDLRPSNRNKQWETIHKFHQVIYIHPVKWGLMRRERSDYRQWQSLYCRSKAFINDISGNKELLIE